MTSSTSRSVRGAIMIAALLSSSVMADEIALMRALSLAQWYHFGFLVVSAAMLAAASAGVFRAMRAPKEHSVAFSCGAAAAGFLLQPVALRFLPVELGRVADAPSLVAFAVLLVLALAAPLFFVGVALTDLLAEREGQARIVYAADLVGAAAGGFVALALLPHLTSMGVLPVCAALAAAAGMTASREKLRLALVALVALSALAVPIAATWLPYITSGKLIGPTPARDVLASSRAVRYTGEDGVARIHVLDTREGPRVLFDAGTAMTRVPPLRGNAFVTPDPIDDDLRQAFANVRNGRVLVIGSGGGWEVLRALSHGAAHVVAVEVSSVVIDYVRNAAPPAVRAMFKDPRVTLVHDEARSYLERTDETFDAILMVHTISNAAAASGALALSEDPLFTVESIRTLVRHLRPEGLLFVTRPDAQLDGLARLVDHAVDTPHRIALWTMPRYGGFMSALLLGRGARMLPPPPPFARERSLPSPDALPLPSDDRPFFHALSRGTPRIPWGSELRAVFTRSGVDDRLAIEALPTSIVVTWLVACLALLATLACAFMARRMTPAYRLSDATAAITLGLGFMLVELTSVSRLVVVIGAPSLAFAIVAGALLLGAGTASSLVGRLAKGGVSVAQASLVAAAGAGIGAGALAWLVPSLLSAPGMLRSALCVVLLLPLGGALGLAFPALLRQAMHTSGRAGVAWTWALNGTASVLGGALAVLVPLHLGLAATALTASAIYATTAMVQRFSR